MFFAQTYLRCSSINAASVIGELTTWIFEISFSANHHFKVGIFTIQISWSIFQARSFISFSVSCCRLKKSFPCVDTCESVGLPGHQCCWQAFLPVVALFPARTATPSTTQYSICILCDCHSSKGQSVIKRTQCQKGQHLLSPQVSHPLKMQLFCWCGF